MKGAATLAPEAVPLTRVRAADYLALTKPRLNVLVVATSAGHVLHCKADEINQLEGPGRGVTVIKTEDDDVVIGFIAGLKSDQLVVETDKSGKRFELPADPKQVKGRGGKGHQIIKRAQLVVVAPPVKVQPLANAEGGQGVN